MARSRPVPVEPEPPESSAKRGRRRWPVRVIVALTTLITVGALLLTYSIVLLSTGFYAKQLCSEVFVAGRSHDAVVREDMRNYYPALTMRLMHSRIDRVSGSATASFFGISPMRARHRDGQGCALAFEEEVAAKRDFRGAPNVQTGSMREAEEVLPWRRVSESNQRLEAVIAAAFRETTADTERHQRTRAVLVIQDGKLVAERYAAGFSAESRFAGWSIGKSVAHALVGVLVNEGRVRLDEPVPVPEWVGDDRRQITWDQMLRMTHGLAFDERYLNPRSDVNLMLWRTADISGFAAQAKLEAPPGRTWKYTSGTTNVLMRAVRARLGPGESHLEFPRRALFERIGMKSAVMETDATGNFVASSFVYATARDFARFAWLYAMDGAWNGERILPEGWVSHAARSTPASADGLFGAHFWVTVPPEDRHYFKRLPGQVLQAAGFGGQRLTILPADRVVIARFGQSVHREAWNHWKFVADVLDAIDPSAAQ